MIGRPVPSSGPAWGRALAVAGGAHLAAIGALFVHFIPATPAVNDPPAIAVEMAPPVALPAPKHDTPTPRQVEAPERTPQKQPEPKKLPFPPPPLQVADAKPEVVLPPRKVEQPPPEKVSPLPPAPTTTQQAAPDLKPDTRVAALLTGGAAPGKASAADIWDARVRSRIELKKRYPALAEQQLQQDDVNVFLAVDRTGHLLEARIKASRGFGMLDAAALEAVRNAAPYPKAPAEITGDPIRLTVFVRFYKKAR